MFAVSGRLFWVLASAFHDEKRRHAQYIAGLGNMK
jgi:hypothetical protein